MIKIPIFDPSSMSILDKLNKVYENTEIYNSLTNSSSLIGYINFVLPEYLQTKELKTPLVSPNLITKELVADFYDTDLTLYINYFATENDATERISMYESDYFVKQKRLSLSWQIIIFLPLHSILKAQGKEKFNMQYGAQLIDHEINLFNIQKYIRLGIKHFNLIFMTITNEILLKESRLPLIEELAVKYPDIEFLIYAKDSNQLDIKKGNIKAVVGSIFWKGFF